MLRRRGRGIGDFTTSTRMWARRAMLSSTASESRSVTRRKIFFKAVSIGRLPGQGSPVHGTDHAVEGGNRRLGGLGGGAHRHDATWRSRIRRRRSLSERRASKEAPSTASLRGGRALQDDSHTLKKDPEGGGLGGRSPPKMAPPLLLDSR